MSQSQHSLPFVLAITGASGSIYGLRLLQFLLESDEKVELVVSKGALQVMREEIDLYFGDLPHEKQFQEKLLKYLSVAQDAQLIIHQYDNCGASVASGSYRTQGMAIVPCSVGTLGAVAAGLTDNLINRAAQVCLKERRKLMLVLREMPFGHIQLKNMLALSEAGAIVSCASPAFYHKPRTISDQIDFVVGRVLDQFDFDHSLFTRWAGNKAPLELSQIHD